MDKREEQLIQATEVHKSHSNTKFIIGSIIAVLLFVIAAVLLHRTGNKGNNAQTNPTLSPSQTVVNPSQTINRNFNPLINNAEVERVENSLRKKMESAGITISPKPVYKFHYKLDPALQHKNSVRLVKPVLAANTCNINSAPSTLSIYSLKDHLTVF